MTDRSSSTARRVAAVWGLVGVVLILGDAIVRVWPFTLDALRHHLSTLQWVVLAAWVLSMGVGEGYRGFQLRFSRRVVARRDSLRRHGHGVDLVLAPLYCIGYFHAERRQVISSWSLTVGIVVLILLVRLVDQPWRGIIDAGVVAGLAYGLVSLLVLVSRSRPAEPPVDTSRGSVQDRAT
ncbi:hypothetical protein [uncultured Jatrophihabitans sp.]|uniref:hypothetical protein n=1 Tax=uncultured Jatrophihabitans sp. TaxID=1610747 RepID=UPI0035CC4EC0